MKNLLKIIFIGIVVYAGVMVYKTPYSPCDVPLTYKIGTVDPKFGLKTTDVLTDIDEATKLLSDAWGKKLFAYENTSGEITVNFVYDQRSELNKNVIILQNQINQKDLSLQEQINGYEADAKILEQKIADLNAIIQKYNQQGGAPANIYQSLIDQQNQLKTEEDSLNTRAKQLNLATKSYNLQVKVLNQNVAQFNKAIEQQPEEGKYDKLNKTITVYFAKNKVEMVHLLAHEFGHALGMGHVDNPKAIMYLYTTTNLEMTTEDKQQLEIACKQIPMPLHWINWLRDRILMIKINKL